MAWELSGLLWGKLLWFVPGDGEAVVEDAVGEEEPDQEDEGEPPGEEDEAQDGVDQEQDGFQEEFH